MTPEQAEQVFSAPLGVMLGRTGVLSQEQQDKSGYVQAQMIAVRRAIENGTTPTENAENIIGVFKGNIDFGAMAKTDDDNRAKMLSQLHVTQDDIDFSIETVNNAQKNRSNVNDGHDINIPPIGFIHLDLHAKNIEGFGNIKQAALLSQRAIDASHSINRLDNDHPNPDLAGKRGFKLWGDEHDALKEAIIIGQSLQEKESEAIAGHPATVSKKDRERVAGIYDAAVKLYIEAGQNDLADRILAVREHLSGSNNDHERTPDQDNDHSL